MAGFGPEQVGYEKLRPALDRPDRVRLRPIGEGGAIYVEKGARDGPWTAIPAVPPFTPKSFDANAAQAGLDGAKIEALLATAPMQVTKVKKGHTGEFDALPTEERIRFIHASVGRRERESARSSVRSCTPPTPTPMSRRALLAAVSMAVEHKKSAAHKAEANARVLPNAILDIGKQFEEDVQRARTAVMQVYTADFRMHIRFRVCSCFRFASTMRPGVIVSL